MIGIVLINRLRLKNVLSFIDATIELRGLNVLIGPNAVGKSNLVEAIGLLQAAPSDLNTALLRQGGVRQFISLAGSVPSRIATIECSPLGAHSRYELEFSEDHQGFLVMSERLEDLGGEPNSGSRRNYFERTSSKVKFYQSPADANPALALEASVQPKQSVFAAYKNPADPTPITRIGRDLDSIRIYREFRTAGITSGARQGVSASVPKSHLEDGGDNLAVVLQELDFRGTHERIREYLQRLCDRFEDVKIRLDGSIARTYILETGLLEPLGAARLSDGTLKFLCLLCVLFDPDIPPLVCIEEPEVGLHPDAIKIVADALVDASKRSQIIVTTHSEALVDALSDRPDDVLVAERDFDGGTRFSRLNSDQLAIWLERYSLGTLWRKGEIGGNRW